DDELEQVLDDYEEEELSEIEAYMADSQEEYEEKTDLLPFDYNPWNEENPVYLTLEIEKSENEWHISSKHNSIKDNKEKWFEEQLLQQFSNYNKKMHILNFMKC
ncbi:9797_t:CDS:2, partial [Funneliformis caledonium]